MIFPLILCFISTAFSQVHKQLIVNFEYGTSYQSLPEEQSGTVFSKVSADTVTITSIKEFEAFKKRDLSKYDDVIFSANTHGSQELKGITSHQLELRDGSLAVKEIFPLIKARLAQGKKVALLDFSCFSEPDFKLAKDLDPKKFCLITADTNGSEGMASFRNRFFDSLNNSSNETSSLEELYLKGRSLDLENVSSPGISTEQGLRLLKELAVLESLTTSSEKIGEFQADIDAHDCIIENSRDKITPLTSNVQHILEKFATEGDPDDKLKYLGLISTLKAKLKAYGPFLKDMREVIKQHNDPYFNIDSYLAYEAMGFGIDLDKIDKAMKQMNLNQEVMLIKDMKDDSLNPESIGLLASLGLKKEAERYNSFNALESKLKAKLGDNFFSSSQLDSSFLTPLIEMIKLERKLYSKLYQKSDVSSDNACKTISFKKSH
jgi:hypothetical protein